MLEHLASLGFNNAEILSDGPFVTVRIRTSKGWVYERFPSDDLTPVNTWATRHKPEVQ